MKDFLLTMVAFRPHPTDSKEVRDVIDKTVREDSKLDLETPNKPNPILEVEQNFSTMDDQCRLYFNVFDINETGYIDKEELKLVVGSLLQEGNSLSTDALLSDENRDRSDTSDSNRRNSDTSVHKTMLGKCNIEELFDVIDIDKSGRICFEEFQKFYDAVLTFSTQRSFM